MTCPETYRAGSGFELRNASASLFFTPLLLDHLPEIGPERHIKGKILFCNDRNGSSERGWPKVIKLVAETGLNSEKREKGQQQRDFMVTSELKRPPDGVC